MKYFLGNIGVYFLKGIGIFLGFGLVVVISDSIGLKFYTNNIYPIIEKIPFILRLIILTIFGAVAHYTFWRT